MLSLIFEDSLNRSWTRDLEYNNNLYKAISEGTIFGDGNLFVYHVGKMNIVTTRKYTHENKKGRFKSRLDSGSVEIDSKFKLDPLKDIDYKSSNTSRTFKYDLSFETVKFEHAIIVETGDTYYIRDKVDELYYMFCREEGCSSHTIKMTDAAIEVVLIGGIIVASLYKMKMFK